MASVQKDIMSHYFLMLHLNIKNHSLLTIRLKILLIIKKEMFGTNSHYNPKNQPHPSHAGDLPPLLSCKGSAYMQVKTDRFRICDIIGRTVIIHSDIDDFRTQPSGDAGEKTACGVIRAV